MVINFLVTQFLFLYFKGLQVDYAMKSQISCFRIKEIKQKVNV